MFWTVFISLLVVFITASFVYSQKKHSYWSSKNVPSPATTPFLGNIMDLFSKKEYVWKIFDNYYMKFKDVGYYGSYEFFTPKITICSPELLKSVLVKDFDYFVDRRKFKVGGERDELMGQMVVNASKDKWKYLRNLITPTFTSGKLKSMFPLIEKEADSLIELCLKKSGEEEYIDIEDGYERFGINVIASCAFGVDGQCFDEDAPRFLKLLQTAFEYKFNFTLMLKAVLYNVCFPLFKLLKLSITPDATIELTNIVKATLAERRDKNIRRGDFLDNMLDAMKEAKSLGSSEDVMDENIVIAQSLLFILAGYDTTRNNLCFASYNIAKYPDLQLKLRDEITQAIDENGLTYQALSELKYMDAFISESMRIYPSAYITERECTKDYKIPDSDVVIPENMVVGIPIYSLHNDSKYWSEPEKFDPERFLPENQEKIVPYTFLPFGLGPRNCLGMRFALLEMKMALAKLILNFDMSLKEDYELSPQHAPVSMKPANGVWVQLKDITSETHL